MDQIDINQIKKNTTNNIAIELYRKDQQMKTKKKRKYILLAVLSLISLSGIKTVDAYTDGEISKRISFFLTGENQQKIEMEGDVYKDENGDTWIKYKKDGFELDVNKTELEKNDLDIETYEEDGDRKILIKDSIKDSSH